MTNIERFDSENNYIDQNESEDYIGFLDLAAQNERIDTLGRVFVSKMYTKNELLADSNVNQDAINSQVSEIKELFISIDAYSEDVSEYYAYKKTLDAHLDELDLRNNILEIVMNEQGEDRQALDQLYLHEFISRNDMDRGWHKVVSTMIDADLQKADPEDVADLHKDMDLNPIPTRKDIMHTVIDIDGAELYTDITGTLQSESQIDLITRAGAMASTIKMPGMYDGRDDYSRGFNYEIICSNLDELNMSEERKDQICDELMWLF